MNDEKRKEIFESYWKKNVALILSLLTVWALVSLVGAIILAEPFSKIPFFGVTLSFWLAQQGSILVFVILIFTYAAKMERLDKEALEQLKNDSNKPRGVSA